MLRSPYGINCINSFDGLRTSKKLCLIRCSVALDWIDSLLYANLLVL